MSDDSASSDDEASGPDVSIAPSVSDANVPPARPIGNGSTATAHVPSTKDASGRPRPPGSAHAQAHAQKRELAGHGPKFSLPAEKVFPIQIGTELFRLSGASISSDGPSYFTQTFEDQLRQNQDSGGVRTLYIDRDPVTFRDIARHLQGYHIKPVDGAHFVRLFADAQFYCLPRFITQLFESEIFIQIGEKHFQIPKDIFSDPGNSPNFFSLGFAVFFSTPGDVFPGLDKRGLLRPPPINPPYVPSRSSEIFTQLMHLLRGYPIEVDNEVHRAQLLRDCRYFHLRGLEQHIIAHSISYNSLRARNEICLRIEDLKPSGISFKTDAAIVPDDPDAAQSGHGWIYYARPFVDEKSYELIIEVGNESATVDLAAMRAEFHCAARARIGSLFSVIANKMDLEPKLRLGLIAIGREKRSPSPGFSSLSDDRVKVCFEPESDLTVDGQPHEVSWDSPEGVHMRFASTRPREQPDPQAGMQPQPQQSKASRKIGASARSGREGAHADSTGPGNNGGGGGGGGGGGTGHPASKKRKLSTEQGPPLQWKWAIRRAQWRLRVLKTSDPARSGYEIVLAAVKIDAYSHERARNQRRGFLE